MWLFFFFFFFLESVLSGGTYRAITSRPCEVYRLTGCDVGGGVCECDHLALGDSCDNEGCAREESFAKHCDCCCGIGAREGMAMDVLKEYFLKKNVWKE